jgi:hypothetical protein
MLRDCLCDWDSSCSGSGVLRCRGCGGDLCVCTCRGEMECPGCEYCADGDLGDAVFGWPDYDDDPRGWIP